MHMGNYHESTCKQHKYHLDIGFYIFVHEFANRELAPRAVISKLLKWNKESMCSAAQNPRY